MNEPRPEEGTIDVTQLRGVSATTVWTLYNRAAEAARPDGVLQDPVAIELLAKLDDSMKPAFGSPDQSHPLRAVCYDDAVRRFLQKHPDGTVVALGDGLETGFWRTDNGRVRWLSVDLPEVIEVRQQLLPPNPRIRHLACSVVDRSWMHEVDTTRPVLVTAQGLLPYLQPTEALQLILDCAARFRGGQMIFDFVPPWYSWLSRRNRPGFPGFSEVERPFGVTVGQINRLPDQVPDIVAIHYLRRPTGRGWKRRAVDAVGRLPVLRNHRHSVALLEFA
jgi:O-methyltransferase involved in polyketide biosynthesis